MESAFDALVKAFVENGFSVIVAAFLLLRMERELRLLRAAIETLRHCPICKVSPWKIEDEDKK